MFMKIACQVIRDLLPLYKDQVCSSQSRDLVEEHLCGCEECREYYEQMEAELPGVDETREETEAIQSDLKFLKTVKRKLTYRQILTGAIAALLLLIVYALVTSCPAFADKAIESIKAALPVLDRRISTDDIEVLHVYRLENGAVYCSFAVDSYISSVGKEYVIEEKDGKPADVYAMGGNTNGASLERYWSDFHKADGYRSVIDFIVPEELAYFHENPESSVVELIRQTSDGVYYVGKGGEILPLYEKGDVIPAAPEEIEEQAREYLLENEAEVLEAPEEGETGADRSYNDYWFVSLNEKK